MSATPSIQPNEPSTDTLERRFADTRDISCALIETLSAEDACVQSMPDCSPAKWHLAHTTWFFETFLLESATSYRLFHPQFKVLFNSYYNTVGEQHPRPSRGLLTRPSLAEILDYRAHVDSHLQRLVAAGVDSKTQSVIEVGIQHEQQHQELLLMDIKHLLAQNPLNPTFKASSRALSTKDSVGPINWQSFDGGLVEIGASGKTFCFDNELPRHRQYLEPYELADRLVTNGEYLDFVNDGGYDTPSLWLSDGWSTAQQYSWHAPLYWRGSRNEEQTGWREFTLHGEHELDLNAPVVHVSFYEAEAFARWAGKRLPSESEWENAVASLDSTTINNKSLLSRTLHTTPVGNSNRATLKQLFDQTWQWTASAYLPYPGYVTPAGAIGEYNGKFMSNQMVLKGGCCVTPDEHTRSSYRNFFYPRCRWQFGGIRLAG
ncbi:MAG: ergothioneine biosynthesis protein EgtB [Gammaproteobacteria bacterium]